MDFRIRNPFPTRQSGGHPRVVAYYAAYWTARNYLAKDPHFAIPPGKPVHAYVIKQYIANNDPALQDIGTDLETLRIERITADYKAEDPVTLGDATSSAILAAKLIHVIETL